VLLDVFIKIGKSAEGDFRKSVSENMAPFFKIKNSPKKELIILLKSLF